MLRFWKVVLYNILLVAVLFLACELSLRIVYFQFRARSPLALITTARSAKTFISRKLAIREIELEEIPPHTFDSLWTKTGESVLKEFTDRYEKHFKTLTKKVAEVGSKQLVVYIPTGSSTLDTPASRFCRKYFRQLCAKYSVAFYDCTTEFSKHKPEEVFLLPRDDHLSRFGNLIVANKIAEQIEPYKHYRSSVSFETRPQLLGDLTPNHNEIWEYDVEMPYRVRTNSQGFRIPFELQFPKQKQRVLMLGDSFTFGVFLNYIHTYSGILNRICSGREFINAGKAGYTITDEASLFDEKAKYVEPDITILQVLDNDLYGLFYFKMNSFDRNGRKYKPSAKEQEFLNALR